jgi:hypothetical protein
VRFVFTTQAAAIHLFTFGPPGQTIRAPALSPFTAPAPGLPFGIPANGRVTGRMRGLTGDTDG